MNKLKNSTPARGSITFRGHGLGLGSGTWPRFRGRVSGRKGRMVPNNRREPYRGTPPSVGDVISGRCRRRSPTAFRCCRRYTSARYARSAYRRASNSRSRAGDSGDCPEILPGFDLSAWYRIVDRLNDAGLQERSCTSRLGGAAGACRCSALLGRQAQRQFPSSPASRRSFRQR